MQNRSQLRKYSDWPPAKAATLVPLAGLCLTAGFAALYLRIDGIGSILPTPQEAGNAWPAWAASSGLPAMPADPATHPAGPLEDNLAWLLFQCLGASDRVARSGPVLMGSLLVFLPLLLRSWLGWAGSLAAMLLLAADPWQRAYSRSGDGVIFSAFLALASLAWMDVIRLRHERQPTNASGFLIWMVPGALGGLFAMSGVEFWSLAPPVLLYFVLTGMRGKDGAEDGSQAFAPLSTGRIWAAFSATILLAGVLFGVRWENAERFGWSLSSWLDSWGTAAAHGYSWEWVCVRYLREQPLTLAAGLSGLLMLWRESANKGAGNFRGRAAALAIWATWGLVLTIPGGRGAAGLLVSDLALKLAAAFALGKILVTTAGSWNPSAWVMRILGSLGLIALGLIWFRLNRHSPPLLDESIWPGYAVGALAWVACVLARHARGSFTMTLLPAVLLLALEFHGSRELGRQVGSEPVFFESIAHPDLRQLKSDLNHWVSTYQEGGASVCVRIGAGTPHSTLIAWYLREFVILDREPARSDAAQQMLWITGERTIPQQPPERWPPIRFAAVLHRTSGTGNPDRAGIAPLPAPSMYSSEAVWLWLPRQ